MTQPPLAGLPTPRCCVCGSPTRPPAGGRCLLHDWTSNPATGEVRETGGCGLALCGRAHCTRTHYAEHGLSPDRLDERRRRRERTTA